MCFSDRELRMSIDNIEDSIIIKWIKFKKENKIKSNNEALRRILEYYNNIKSEYSLND